MKKKFLKITALLLAINFLTTALAPTLTYALTAGPTAPEYTSFEPVDTTDMVNLATGDFTYNIPLLEVPGPEGGYPLALSYHAGISPSEESSWVGLGWSLNAGAINRIVNGHADDLNGTQEVVHDTWSGGETNVTSIGIGIGLAAGSAALGVGVGLDFANDTYKGNGVGANFSAGVSVGSGVSASVGIFGGSNPYGDGGYIGLGIGAGASGSALNASIGVGSVLSFGNSGTELTGFAGAGVGISYGVEGHRNSVSLIDVSMNTKSDKASVGLIGISASTVNDNVDNISMHTSNMAMTIPVWYGIYISMGRSKTRYYLDQVDVTSLYGSLYSKNIPSSNYGDISYDCFALKAENSLYSTDADKLNAGSMPAYDNYQVLGQGIGGVIQPYIYEAGTLFRKRQNSGNTDLQVTFDYNTVSAYTNNVGFRFMNDFSNTFTRNVTETNNSSLPSGAHTALVDASIGTLGTSYSDLAIPDFDKSTGQLAGSKHIEWFTNSQIAASAGIIPDESPEDYKARLAQLKGFMPDMLHRPDFLSVSGYGVDVPDNIGGFMITNESGLTYHYSLPVYNFSEITSYSSSAQGTYNRTIRKTIPYAYSWLVTAMTGPDYVDRAPYGVIDENDWGYWVKFEYGKWTDQYIWRGPEAGLQRDIDSEYGSYSTGKKELYYLDAIKTRSHTALFVKDLKRDGKGVGSQTNGGFDVEYNSTSQITDLPVGSLRLDKILLYSNRMLKDLLARGFGAHNNSAGISTVDDLKAKGTNLNHSYTRTNPDESTTIVHYHTGEKVLDLDDLAKSSEDFLKYSIRQFGFTYSYNLCPQTINSFDMNYSGDKSKDNIGSGKLTLESVEVRGLNNTKIMPATSFDYWLEATPYNNQAVDIWGSYKSDYTQDYATRVKTVQTTTEQSAASVHAWSLKQITTSIGAKINVNYESDRIKETPAHAYKNIAVNTMTREATSGYLKMTLYSSEALNNTTNLFELAPNKYIDIVCQLKYNEYSGSLWSGGMEANINSPTAFAVNNALLRKHNVKIISVTPTELVIECQPIYDYLNTLYHSTSPQTDYILKYANGNILIPRDNTKNTYGGGLRVASVGVYADNVENITTYQYEGGTTSYEPIDLNICLDRSVDSGLNGFTYRDYQDAVYEYYAPVIANTPFLPPPGVIYNKVIVQDMVKHYQDGPTSSFITIPGQGSMEYEFSVFDAVAMHPRESISGGLSPDGYYKGFIKFKDVRNQIGLLKKVKQYSGPDRTGDLISEMENHYLHDGKTHTEYADQLNTKFRNQGRVDQVFFERKSFFNNGTATKAFEVTEIEEYPVVPIGVTYKDYKKGIEEQSKTLKFDFYSGYPIASWSKDAYENEFITEEIPAYTKYGNMSYKVNNSSHKNMLSQSAGSTTYKVTPNVTNPMVREDFDVMGIVTANVQIWGDGTGVRTVNNQTGVGIESQGNIWRRTSSFSWIGNDARALNTDGTHDKIDFVPFNFNSVTNINWQKNGQITLVNPYSKPLEVIDLNGLYSATLFDPQSQYIVASSSGARYNHIAYSGAEFSEYYTYNSNGNNSLNVYEGNVKTGQGVIVKDSDRSHTGSYSLKVNQNQEGFSYSFTPEPSINYRASVWLYLPGTAEGAGNDQASNAKLICRVKQTGQVLFEAQRSTDFKSRSHYLLDLSMYASQIPHNGSVYPELEVVCISNNADRSIYFDDFRFHPMDASFTSFVYDLDRCLLTHTLDGDNYYTRYEYDNMGRLVRSFREIQGVAEKKVSEQIYNYGSK